MLDEETETVSDTDVLRCVIVGLYCYMFRLIFKSHHQAKKTPNKNFHARHIKTFILCTVEILNSEFFKRLIRINC
jgi:hypothetical protein